MIRIRKLHLEIVKIRKRLTHYKKEDFHEPEVKELQYLFLVLEVLALVKLAQLLFQLIGANLKESGNVLNVANSWTK